MITDSHLGINKKAGTNELIPFELRADFCPLYSFQQNAFLLDTLGHPIEGFTFWVRVASVVEFTEGSCSWCDHCDAQKSKHENFFTFFF